MRVNKSSLQVSSQQLLRYNLESRPQTHQDYQEEPTLESIYGWPTHRRAVLFVERYLDLFGLTFNQIEGKNLHHKDDRSLLRSLSTYIVTTCCLYMPIKFGIIAWLQFNHDSLLKRWQPQIREGSMQFDRCVLEKDLIVDKTNDEVLAQVYEVEGWLNWLGHTGVFTTGGMTMVFSMMIAMCPFCLIGNFYYLKIRPVRVDFLCFMRDKLAQRANMKRKQNNIVATLIKSVQLYRRSIGARSWSRGTTQVSQEVQYSGHAMKESEEGLRFTHLLWSVCTNKLEEPANLTDRWHRRLTRLYHDWHAACYISCSSFCFVLIIAFVLGEVYLRAARRLDQVICRRWNPNGTLIDWQSIKLDQLGAQDVAAYEGLAEEDNVTMLTLLSFGISHELPLTFGSTNSWLYLLEMYALFNLQCMCWCFFHSIIVFGMLDKFIWISQLDGQITKTTDMLKDAKEREFASGKDNKIRPLDNYAMDSDIIESSLVSYINYTLSENCFSNFQITMNRFIEQSSCVTVEVMVVCYYVSTNTNSTMLWPVFYALSFILMVSNFCFITGSYMYAKLAKIMRNIMVMSALARERPTNELNFISDIWRRHVLDKSGMDEIFSFHIFGTKISYDKVVLLNAYMLALWIIMWKGEG